MKNIPLVLAVALLLLSTSAPADAAECTIPDEQLDAISIPLEKRAARQDDTCELLLVGNPPTLANWNGCTTVRDDLDAAIKFCTDPLKAKYVSAEKLELARREAEADVANRCSSGSKTVTPQSGLPLALGFQDDLIRGLAKFVVARAKAEAMAWLITRLKDKVCSDSTAKKLLPASCALLADTTADGTAPMAWGTLKAAFEEDLDHLPERAAACVASQAGAPDGVPDILYATVQAARLIHEGEDPMEVLVGLTETYPMKDKAACAADKAKCGLNMVGFTVHLLTPLPLDPGVDPATTRLPLPINEARFLKIVARRWWDRAVGLGLISEDTELKDHAEDAMARLRQLHRGVMAVAEAVKAARVKLTAVTEQEFRFQAVAELARATVSVLEAMVELVPEQYLTDVSIPRAKLAAALAVVDELAEALDQILDGEYAKVLVKVVLASGAIAAKVAAKKFEGTTLSATFRKYAPFVTEVASAKTPEDVQRALETAAAPVGGGLAKRSDSRRTVAVTAYLGAQIGREQLEAPDGESTWGTHGGLFAPVGVDITWGIADCVSLGGFLSVIDLGALTSLRTKEEVESADGMTEAEVESTPEIGFRQVLAPGAYFVFGFDRFAIGVGGSMTPRLRRISDDGELIEEATAFRLGFFASVDVTIFPF